MSTVNTHQEINRLQNTARSLDLLKAADVAHQRAQRAEVARAAAVAVLAALAVLSSFKPEIADVIAIIGVAASVGTEVIWPWFSRQNTTTAMLLQEMFDTELFALPWNTHLGDKVSGPQIERLKAVYHRGEEAKRDWYVDVSGLSRADAVMVCQRQNLLWDSELRLAWAGRVVGLAVLWLVAGVAVALIDDWTTRQFFVRWLAPSLPLILFVGVHAFGHWKIATDKDATRRELDHILDTRASRALSSNRHSELMHKARARQDKIADQRRHTERVPRWFYTRRQPRDQVGHDEDAARIRERLLGLGSPQDAGGNA
ncbi:MAG: S-4TM family putative pore-forming effector [Actinomycetota bacterium]|nr:S-4TM family putative pore-forming effector [Actinomycetota bacterium]